MPLVWIAVYHHGLIVKEEDLPYGVSIKERSAVATCLLIWDGKGFFPISRLTELFLSVFPHQ